MDISMDARILSNSNNCHTRCKRVEQIPSGPPTPWRIYHFSCYHRSTQKTCFVPSSLPTSHHFHIRAQFSQWHMCNKSTTSTPFRVAIAGAGVAGLSTALALLRTAKHKNPQITIFESRNRSTSIAGGASLNLSGGAAILSNYYELSLSKLGYPMRRVTARTTVNTPSLLFSADIESLLQNSSQQVKEALRGKDGSTQIFVMSREQLILKLREQVEGYVTFIEGDKGKVVNIKSKNGMAWLHVADGSTHGEFDLVVGADGLRSQVRSFVAGRVRPPEYTGIRVQWAVTKKEDVSLPFGELQQWFGDGGYSLRFAAGRGNERKEIVTLSFRERNKTEENEGYSQSEESMKERFKRRMLECKMPMDIVQLVDNAERLIETGVYSHQILDTWSRDACCVLVGDSAHAMAPFLGQGANQAIQDAHTLAVAISGIGSQYKDLAAALDKYENIRKTPTKLIMNSSNLVGFLETQKGSIGTRFRDGLFRTIGLIGLPGRVFLSSALPRVE